MTSCGLSERSRQQMAASPFRGSSLPACAGSGDHHSARCFIDKFHHFRQANAVEVIFVENCPPGLGANRAKAARVSECFDDALCNLFDVKKGYDQTVVFVEDLNNRRRLGSNDEASGAQGLKQRPRQHERISQINVRGGDLQSAEII